MSGQETQYLGYELGQGEVRPQVDKMTAILDCPCTSKEVWSFLGLVGWYRRFVPQFATIAASLTALIGKNYKNPLPWSDDCEAAFHNLRASPQKSWYKWYKSVEVICFLTGVLSLTCLQSRPCHDCHVFSPAAIQEGVPW